MIFLQTVFIVLFNLIPVLNAVGPGLTASRLRRCGCNFKFTPEEAQAIVDRHNELRSQVRPEAANMQYMNWDYPLASMAQQYAELCTLAHGQVGNNTSSFSPIGQNIWYQSGTLRIPPSGVRATDAWYNEVRHYNYSSRQCAKVCGHYTQIVWDNSYAVGCGRQMCTVTVKRSNPNREDEKGVWLIVCNYGPAGNYNRHPYIAGPNCTKCSTNVGQCYDGLCRLCDDHNETCVCRQVCKNCGILDNENCTCACQQGFTGGDCSHPCEDKSRYCGRGWYRRQCSYYQPAIKLCPKMCGSCVAPDPDFVCDEPLEIN